MQNDDETKPQTDEKLENGNADQTQSDKAQQVEQPDNLNVITELDQEAKNITENTEEIDHEIKDEIAEVAKTEIQNEPKVEAPLQPLEDKTKKKRRIPKKAIPVIALVIVLLLASAAFAVYQKIMTSPEVIARDALVNSLSAESASFTGEMEIQTGQGNETFSGIEISGQIGQDNYLGLNVGLDLVISQVNIDLKTNNEKLYLKANGLEIFSSLLSQNSGGFISDETAKEVINSIEDQWIKVDLKDSPILSDSGIDEQVLSEEAIKELEDSFYDNIFITIEEDFGKEDVDGAESYHYKIGLDKEKLKQFAKSVKQSESIPDDFLNASEEDINKEIDNLNTENINLEIWIDAEKKLINKISLNLNDQETSIKLDMKISDYNEQVDTTLPDDSEAKSLEEIYSAFFSSYLGDLDIDDDGESSVKQEVLAREEENQDSDNQRKEDIDTIYIELLTYYSANNIFPSSEQMKDYKPGGWVLSTFAISEDSLLDPSGAGINEVSGYSYTSYPAGCDNSITNCTSFSLSADLSTDKRGVDDLDGSLADYTKSY